MLNLLVVVLELGNQHGVAPTILGQFTILAYVEAWRGVAD